MISLARGNVLRDLDAFTSASRPDPTAGGDRSSGSSCGGGSCDHGPKAAVVRIALGTHSRTPPDIRVSPGSTNLSLATLLRTEVDVEVTLRGTSRGGPGHCRPTASRTSATVCSRKRGRYAVRQYSGLARCHRGSGPAHFFLGTIGWRDGARENDWPVGPQRDERDRPLALYLRDDGGAMEYTRSGATP